MRFDTLQTNIDELKTSVEKLYSKKHGEAVSPAESHHRQQTKTSDKQPGHDLNKSLLVTSSSNFSNSVTNEKEFAKRLTYAFTNETEATEVFEKWVPTFLGNESKIRRPSEVEKPNKTVIIKKVPIDIDNSQNQL